MEEVIKEESSTFLPAWVVIFTRGLILMVAIGLAIGLVHLVIAAVDGRIAKLREELALSYTTGVCAIGGPTNAGFYCGNWGFPVQVGELFYRCGLEMVDNYRIVHHLHVAQFASEEEALRGINHTSAISCDLDRNVVVEDAKGWNIPSIKHLQLD